MTYRDRHLEADLLRLADAHAYSRLLRSKLDIVKTRRWADKNAALLMPDIFEKLAYYEAKLKDIPEGVACDCCSFQGLVNVRFRDGKTLGPECWSHALGACRKVAPMARYSR